MSLAGQVIKLHNFRTTLRNRLASRKHVGPYMWTVPAASFVSTGRGFYFDGHENVSTSFNLRCYRVTRMANGRKFDGYGYADCGGVVYPYVFALPHGRGYLAGCGEGANMWGSVSTRTIYTDRDEAEYAAHEDAFNSATAMQEEHDMTIVECEAE